MLPRAVMTFAAGCVVYGVMAACSGRGTFGAPVPDVHADTAVNGTRLSAAWIAGEDGSRQDNGWFDTKRNEYCSFMLSSDGETRCLPNADHDVSTDFGSYEISVFTDAACTQPVYFVKTQCSSVRKQYFALVEPAGNACPATPHVFTYGAAIPTSAALYFSVAGGACKAMDANRNANLGNFGLDFSKESFFRGTEVPPSDFVRGTLQH
jgi:hypothetical protein